MLGTVLVASLVTTSVFPFNPTLIDVTIKLKLHSICKLKKQPHFKIMYFGLWAVCDTLFFSE